MVMYLSLHSPRTADSIWSSPRGSSSSTMAMAPELTRGLKGISSLSEMRDMELKEPPEGSILVLWNTASKP